MDQDDVQGAPDTASGGGMTDISGNDMPMGRAVRTLNIAAEGAEGEAGIGMSNVVRRVAARRGDDGANDESLEDKAKRLGIDYRQAKTDDITYDILEYIPEDSALHYQVVPLSLKDGVMEVGMVDPDDIEGRNALTFIFSRLSLPFKITLISNDDFHKIVALYKGLSGEVTKALTDLDTELRQQADITVSHDGTEEEDEGSKIKEDAPITKIVATILRYATEGLASDVHIEPMREQVRVRFRVDGILNTSLTLPINVHSAVAARIKVLCNMKLDEKRRPQDGRFSARIDGRKIDFRVSTFPTYFGEKVVMRILDHERGIRQLKDLNMSDHVYKVITETIKKPYGLILISGPTGSGKTTTLYSMLQEVDREEKNVLSLEDPIEYNIEGVSQSQVFPEIGYTFATGLRTTLRQDPDVILVGEIRDKETAQLAIQAALTGHLVLSTIHTNNAAGVIPRLVDMGVDPFLIAPTLQLAIAQRLGAVICKEAAVKIPVDADMKARIEEHLKDMPKELREQVPVPEFVLEKGQSAECPSGTRGRMAVFEVVEITKEMQRVILKSPTEEEINNVARSQGMTTIREDAMIKALQGHLSISEVDII